MDVMMTDDKRPLPDRIVTVSLPMSHWQQIVSDIENMCGVGAYDIEILSQAVLTDPAANQHYQP